MNLNNNTIDDTMGLQTFSSLRRQTAHAFIGSSRRRFWWRNENVDNVGSLARDILATERTFLAWARTGLGFVGAGSALATAYHREDVMNDDVVSASALLICNGAFLLAFATRRYYSVLTAIRKDKFPINLFDTIFAVALTSMGTLSSLFFVWRAEMSTRPKQQTSKT